MTKKKHNTAYHAYFTSPSTSLVDLCDSSVDITLSGQLYRNKGVDSGNPFLWSVKQNKV